MAGFDLTVEGAYFRKVCFSVPLLYYNIYIFEDGGRAVFGSCYI